MFATRWIFMRPLFKRPYFFNDAPVRASRKMVQNFAVLHVLIQIVFEVLSADLPLMCLVKVFL